MTSTENTTLKYGQKIAWGNGEATVLQYNRLTGKVWIEYNGSKISVNYDDIFGINQKKQECLDYFDRKIAESELKYEEYRNKINLATQRVKYATEQQNLFQKLISNLLNGTKDETTLKRKDRDKYNEFQIQYEHFADVKALANQSIHRNARYAFDEALYQGDLNNQLMIARAMLG